MRQFLTNLKDVYSNDPPVKVIYCYGVWQSFFEEIEECLPFVTFHKGLPLPEHIEYDRIHRLIVLDDLMQQCAESADVRWMFTEGTHHNRISIVINKTKSVRAG